MEIKTCTKCGLELPKTKKYFALDKRNKNGIGSCCKKCDSARCKAFHNKYPEKSKTYYKKQLEKNPNFIRKSTLRKHGLSIEDYGRIFEQQNGLCAICGLPEITYPHLSIDHNHNTNKVRGLLCHKCNSAIGMLNTDNLGILNLEKAIKYLNYSKQT